jgi:PleD family two-component response regulator
VACWAQLQLGRQSRPAVTLSLGVTVFPKHGNTSSAILKAADSALYCPKQAERHRVYMAE